MPVSRRHDGDAGCNLAASGTKLRTLDASEPNPTTAFLSAEEAKERLREVVEGFFFRRLRGEAGGRGGRLLSTQAVHDGQFATRLSRWERVDRAVGLGFQRGWRAAALRPGCNS